MGSDLVLGLIVVVALGFDFTNGFHDTANAMATSIATGALRPRVAVALSGVLNLIGAFLSLSVAATIAGGLIDVTGKELAAQLELVVFAGLCGGIIWNLLTWFLGIPSSSSHALIGGVLGAALPAAGSHAVRWHGVFEKVIIPAGLSPVIAVFVATVGTYLIWRITRDVPEATRTKGFRIGQIGSASMVSLAHGTNDAQKTMGVITLALIAHGTLKSGAEAPFWVILACALAISIGTYCGGWRVIRTLGKGLVEIEAPQGMAEESSSAAVILLSSHFGYSLSTTHVSTGSILGSGIGRKGAEVRWSVAGRMATAWLITLPAAGVVGALSYWLADGISGAAGVLVVCALLLTVATLIFVRSRVDKVGHDNVNDEWPGSRTAPAHREEVCA